MGNALPNHEIYDGVSILRCWDSDGRHVDTFFGAKRQTRISHGDVVFVFPKHLKTKTALTRAIDETSDPDCKRALESALLLAAENAGMITAGRQDFRAFRDLLSDPTISQRTTSSGPGPR